MPGTKLPFKSAATLRTVRQIKSFRSGRTSTGVPSEALDRGRIRFEHQRLSCRKRHLR